MTEIERLLLDRSERELQALLNEMKKKPMKRGTREFERYEAVLSALQQIEVLRLS